MSVIVGLLLFPFAAGNLWWREAFDSAHTLVFIVVAFVIYFQLTEMNPSPGMLVSGLLVLGIGVTFGISIEVIQGYVGRDTSWGDLKNDLLGLAAGLVLIGGFYGGSGERGKKKLLSIVAASAFIVLGSLSLIELSGYYFQQAKSFPVILDFKAPWAGSFVRFNDAELLPRTASAGDANNMSRIRFDAGQYPGFEIIEPVPDWSAYHYLHFQVVSSDVKDVDLVLRIHDIEHNNDFQDRFNQKFRIHPGLNDIAISLAEVAKGPVGRKLDLSRIAGIIIFLNDIKTSYLLDISDVYLE